MWLCVIRRVVFYLRDIVTKTNVALLALGANCDRFMDVWANFRIPFHCEHMVGDFGISRLHS